MYTGLLHLHSGFRYIVLLILVIVVIKSLIGWLSKKYDSRDNVLSLSLLIATHLQLVFGIVLYFVSPLVQFNSSTMKDATTRYWTVEHFFMMILAIILITIARISHKKLSTDDAKQRRLFLLNAGALVIVLIAIYSSGRGYF